MNRRNFFSRLTSFLLFNKFTKFKKVNPPILNIFLTPDKYDTIYTLPLNFSGTFSTNCDLNFIYYFVEE